MRRSVLIFIVILIGLPTGFYIRDALTAPPDRAAISIALFATYCLPMVDGISPEPDSSLSAIAMPSNGLGWVELRSKLVLSFEANRCSVSDILAPFSEADRTAFQTEAAALIAAKLPVLKPTQTVAMEGWDYFAAWSQPIAGGAENPNWGVSLTRWRDEGEDAETRLTLSLPVH